MNTRKLFIAFAAMGATTALVAGAASAAVAATPTDGPAYLFDNDAAAYVADGTTLDWSQDILISPSKTDPFQPYQCPADATHSISFWTTPGTERDPKSYKAWNLVGLNAQKTIIAPDISPVQTLSGSMSTIRSTGGDYSIGVACAKDNGVNFASSGAWWFTAHVGVGTGKYTFDPVTSTPTDPGNPPSGTGSIGIEATTVGAQDGTLSLVVPSGAKATLGTATLVNQLSTSTGALPQFQVSDQRVVTKPGWDLTASTADFVNAADSTKKIDSKQLGVKPKLVTNPGGVLAGTEHVAGDATAFSGFASAAAGSGTGTTNLSADLTLVAPASTPAGTYDSTMTLTLVSK
ncbi:hypothetical protein [Leifsonia sp. TF02-11]|uniref:hypothetical protein n=1 Tax=Leifsonia sp. TF02-11 TaxID=2815212 RepID=UPI001AA10A36|nr:hypothetical protein [Leifsonia sp. TF02-11]MBO1737930.1 hypothetical protein [Leifsonia sp. TF02-11]